MKLKYIKNGKVHSVTLSAYRDFTNPRIAIYHYGQTWYVPRIDADDSSASEFTFRHNNTNCALKTDATVPAMVFSYSYNPAQAESVTLYSNYGDFGVLGDSLGSGGNGPGTEYYSLLQTVIATEPNSTIIGNKNSDRIYIASGRTNVLTGGIGKDYYFFNSGGGVITDYGSGKTSHINRSILASTTTQTTSSGYIGYDRTNPATYKQGLDVLQVNGTVKAIAYEGYGNDWSEYDEKFCAYVVYTADIDGKDYVVKLDNIYKTVTRYHIDDSDLPPKYRSNDYVAARFQIWDTSTGTLDSITSNESLRSSIQNSPYKVLIQNFEKMIAT